MKITEFIEIIDKHSLFITRGAVIDYLYNEDADWSLILRALLIKNLSRHISKSYLLEKLRFMKNHSEAPSRFLDGYGMRIFTAIKEYNQL